MNKEIEIKIPLNPKDKKLVTSWLKKNAKKVGKLHHIEHYLDNPNQTFFTRNQQNYVDARDFLRIRKTQEGDSICFKHWHYDKQTGKSTYCDEYETNVENGEELLKLLQNIGFTKSTKVDKTRTIYKTDRFEVCIDEVKSLGTFMEVEIKKPAKSAKLAIQEILHLMKSMGLKKIKRMDRGYVSMLWNPKFDFGEEITL